MAPKRGIPPVTRFPPPGVSMSISPRTVQVVRSHAAAVDRRAHDFARSFLARLESSGVPVSSDIRTVRRAARGWAWCVRHLSSIESVSIQVKSWRQLCGLAEGDSTRVARTAILAALHDVSRELNIPWDDEVIAAWSDALDAVCDPSEVLAHREQPLAAAA